MILRIICIWLVLLVGLLAALFFKNNEFSPIGVAVAQEVQEEENFYFDNEMPNFTEVEVVKEEKKVATKTTKASKKGSVLVNINTAGISQLILLPGIGEATAQKIIDYRREFGNFGNIDDFKKVKGIGEKKFEAVKNLLVL